jgi:excisionase family DNA binding protein
MGAKRLSSMKADWSRKREVGNFVAQEPGKPDDYLTPQETAELLLVSPITVRQWAQKGLLPAQTTAGGHRRFMRADVERFARDRGIELPSVQQRLLIVDDDRQHNSFLVALFEAHVDGLEVLSAQDGFVAGRLVQEHKPDVVLLDIIMPGIDGVQVCKSIKSDPSTRHIAVVAMTGHHTPELEHRVLEAGATVLLKKPFPADEVITACGFSSDL